MCVVELFVQVCDELVERLQNRVVVSKDDFPRRPRDERVLCCAWATAFDKGMCQTRTIGGREKGCELPKKKKKIATGLMGTHTERERMCASEREGGRGLRERKRERLDGWVSEQCCAPSGNFEMIKSCTSARMASLTSVLFRGRLLI